MPKPPHPKRTRPANSAALALTLLILQACSVPPEAIHDARYTGMIEASSAAIRSEMQSKDLPAFGIAIVDDQTVAWAEGFGFTDSARQQPASAATIYRVGSVSKLFTDIGIMQLVERGELDLDAPVTRYLPDFQPANPFDNPITLRQLMSHRSGLVREPPLGNYFDPTEPTLAQTVASLNSTTLVYPPTTRIKYSNAGIAVVGYVLESQSGQPFAQYLRQAVLLPMGLRHSGFAPSPLIEQKLAHAVMWGYDGREFAAPTFEMGMAPAGSMYASVLDLAQFMKVLFRGGAGERGQVLQAATIDSMLTPQFAAEGESSGFGIGFSLGELDGHFLAGHGGAIYGFATSLLLLPQEKLGVVTVTSRDVANAVTNRLAEYALRALLAHKAGDELPRFEQPQPVDSLLARRLDGRYSDGENSIDLEERNGALFAWLRGMRYQLKMLDNVLITDDRLGYGQRIAIVDSLTLAMGDKHYVRLPNTRPNPAPAPLRDLIGEYGWDHNILFLLEKDQQLHALIEWCFLYPMQEIESDSFAFPDYGLYHGEGLRVLRQPDGGIRAVRAAAIEFVRRPTAEAGQTFRITPLQPVEVLRRQAAAATPPAASDDLLQPDLVDLTTLDPTLKFDIRYATANNFMATPFYSQPGAFLQRPAAEALLRAHHALQPRGYGLLIHDGYRPWQVTKMFWDATPDSLKHFVANPQIGSIHNRGGAVDLTLYDLATGAPVEMVSGYDEFSERAYPDYSGGTARQRWHRELLRDVMEVEGFRVYQYEWWHFNHRDAGRYPILDLRFDEIGPAAPAQ